MLDHLQRAGSLRLSEDLAQEIFLQVYRKLGKAEEANRELDRFRESSQAPRQRR